ncbi:MAG: tetratricopeptide repeat protein [Chloroflexi bacterium]|nr:tetratricopeptide repeat protein [Chloroflexota bacterium]
MQLRVPKKYQRSRRRGLFRGPPRWLLRWLLIFGLAALVYWLVQNPEEARTHAQNTYETVSSRVSNTRRDFFPDAPTPTPDVRTDLAECENAYLLGDFEEAIVACKIAITGRPNDVDLHYRLAHMMVITSDSGTNVERIEEAVDIADKAITAAPEDPRGYIIKAMALDWMREHNLALGPAERALEIDPDSILAKAVIANIYRNLEDYERAASTINEAIEQLEQLPDPDNELVAQVYRNYGRYLIDFAEWEQAIEPYETAYDAMPTHSYIAIELASQVYMSLDLYSQAIAVLERVRTNSPRDASVLYWLSILYSRQGESDSELEVLSICVDANANYVPCLSTLGQRLFWEQNYEQSLDMLERSTELGSDDPYDWFLLARLYYRNQRCDLAAEPLREGYAIRQSTDSIQVGLDDFIRAGSDCNIRLQ